MTLAGGATPAALKRREAVLSMLRWKYATDPFFGASTKIRLRIDAEGNCKVVVARGVSVEPRELLMSTRPTPPPAGFEALAEETVAFLRREAPAADPDAERLFPATADAEGCAIQIAAVLGFCAQLAVDPDPYLRTWPGVGSAPQSSVAFDEKTRQSLRGTRCGQLAAAGHARLALAAAFVATRVDDTLRAAAGR